MTATSPTACITTTSRTAIAAPTTFTEVIWFKAAAGYAGGGKLIGFETPRTGVAVSPSGMALNVPFQGSLDEATVYSGTALSASNITYLYRTR